MLSYKDTCYFIEDFVDHPHDDDLLSDVDNCGDPTLGTEDFNVHRKNSDKITSIIIQNTRFTEVSFSLDDHVIRVSPGCGFEIHRKCSKFSLLCICFPL